MVIDDIFITGSSPAAIDNIINCLKDIFTVKDPSSLNYSPCIDTLGLLEL
jgi:hypothetical protein